MRARRSTPSAIWPLNATTAVAPRRQVGRRPLGRGLEGRRRHRHLVHFRPVASAGPAHGVAPLGGGPRRLRPAEVRRRRCGRARPGGGPPRRPPCAVRMTIDGWPGTGRLTKTAGRRAEGGQLPVQAPGREHHEAVDLVAEGPGGPHLLLGVLAGVDEQELEVGLPGGAPGGPDQGGEVRVGDVGHDHGQVAGAAGDQAPGGPVGDEAELGDDGLDPLAGRRRHQLGAAERPRDRGRVHAGAGGDVLDRHPLGTRRTVQRRYAAPMTLPSGLRAATLARAAAGSVPATTGRRRRRSPTSASAPSPGPTSASTPTTSCAGGWPALIRGRLAAEPPGRGPAGAPGRPLHLAEREPGRGPSAAGPRVASRRWRPAGRRRSTAIAAPATTLVTLTVTEKGYEPDDGARRCVGRGPAPGATGGAPPPVVASLDNVLDNGALLRQRVLEAAERSTPTSPGGSPSRSAFPSSVVDRMVPATTPADLDEVERRLGLRDEAAVVAERHCSWVIEDVDGLPPLADVGRRGGGRRRPVPAAQAVAAQRPALGPRLRRPAGRVRRRSPRPPPIPTVAAFVARLVDDILEVADVARRPRAFADEALAPLPQPGARPHLPPGRRRRLAEAPAAAAAGGRRPPSARAADRPLRRRRRPLVGGRERCPARRAPVATRSTTRRPRSTIATEPRLRSPRSTVHTGGLARRRHRRARDAHDATELGGPAEVLDDDAVAAFVEEQFAGARPRRAHALPRHPRRHPPVPAAAPARRHPPGGRGSGPLVPGGRGARHPRRR